MTNVHRIVVDAERCESNAVCLQAAPDLFDIGDDDIAFALVTTVDDAQLDAAYDAVARCPKGAIAIVATDV